MSKAFLRESDLDDIDPLPAAASPLPPGTKNYMTAQGTDRLRAELEQLVNDARPPLAAIAASDAEAKRDLQRVDQRIRYLQHSLRSAEVVSPGGDDGVVRFGASVTIRDERGEESQYRLVGVDETDLARGWVSWMSPIARALLSHTKGSSVDFISPAGPKRLTIVRVEYSAVG